MHRETAADAAETSSCSLNSGLAIAHIQAASGQKRTKAYIVQSPLDGRNETKQHFRETVDLPRRTAAITWASAAAAFFFCKDCT